MRISAIALIVGFGTSLFAAQALAAPDPGWTVQSSMNDCSGAAAQQTVGCESYASDVYEHLDYATSSAQTADIQVVHAGFDADYYYFEYDFVDPWSAQESTGHNVVLEIDVDAAFESGRGDYYIGMFQKVEFNSTSWIDAYDNGGFDGHVDTNNDVGGSQPLVSDHGGGQGDGYSGDIAKGNDQVWARIVNGNFQVAIRRSVIGDPQAAYFRPWSRQSTSLSKDKLYFHDQNSLSDVEQIDNLCGLPMTTCIGAGPAFTLPDIAVEKSVTALWDPINMSNIPKAIPGSIMQYDIEIVNSGVGSSDADSMVITDPVPANISFRVVDFDPSTAGPVRFVDGSPASGLTYSFVSLSSTTDDLEFSADGGATFSYSPVPDASGVDPSVTHVRVRPQGTFQPSGASFLLQFKALVE